MSFFSYYLIKYTSFLSSILSVKSENFYSVFQLEKNYLMSKYILRRNKIHHVKKLVTRNYFFFIRLMFQTDISFRILIEYKLLDLLHLKQVSQGFTRNRIREIFWIRNSDDDRSSGIGCLLRAITGESQSPSQTPSVASELYSSDHLSWRKKSKNQFPWRKEFFFSVSTTVSSVFL